MNNRNSRNNSKNVTKESEIKDYIIEDYIRRNDNVENLYKVKNIEKYQKDNIDYLITFKNKRKAKIKVEIATNTKDVQHILYEVNSSAKKSFIDYIETTKSDFLFYYFSKTEELIILNLKDLKKWIFQNKDVLKLKAFNSEIGVQEFIMLPKKLLKNQLKSYKSEYIKIHNFNNSIELGKKGEIIIKNFLLKHPNISELYGVEDIKKYQDEDVDLLVVFKNNSKMKVEIKTDGYMTGNIFYETISAMEINSIGCMEKTKADFLFYYFPRSEELYIINMRAYRKWFHENKEKFTQKIIINKCRDERNIYHSEGFLIPKAVLERDFKSYKKCILKFDDKVLDKHSA